MSELRRFFFSSRRRHTRSLCDWSSDVCSSDLAAKDGHPQRRGRRVGLLSAPDNLRLDEVPLLVPAGSEERRVGKEGRSRRVPDHLKKYQTSAAVSEQAKELQLHGS